MVKDVDIFENIVPTKIRNTTDMGSYLLGDKTVDMVFLSSSKDLKNISEDERIKGITDFAMLTSGWPQFITEDRGNRVSPYYLRTTKNGLHEVVNSYGAFDDNNILNKNFGLAPCINIKFDSNFTLNDAKERITQKHKYDRIIYGISLGNYPKTLVSKKLNNALETLYNDGIVKGGLEPTGKWFTINGGSFTNKHIPEFTYNGQKYVRVVPNNNPEVSIYDWEVTDQPKAYWVKVEPIDFIVKNINDIKKGKAKQLELETEDVVISNFNFYSDAFHCGLWEDSAIRAFLNGENIPNYNFGVMYDYKYEGFLDEALNSSFTPVTEYTVSRYNNKICENAFNGCVSLNEVTIHKGIRDIGENAFDGCKFNYAYRDFLDLVLCKELPDLFNTKDAEDSYIDLNKAFRAFKNFDYNLLLSITHFNELRRLADRLVKDKYELPYSFIEEAGKHEVLDLLIENADYRYFKNEVQGLDKFFRGEREEDVAIVMNFARTLGCFSTEKLTDKFGNTTEVLFAQKASSLFAQIIKNRVFTATEISEMFSQLDYDVKPNQELLEFLVKQMKDNQLGLIKRLEGNSCKGLFAKMFTNFDEIKNFRDAIDKDGKPVKLSWENALIKYYAFGMYENVNEENKDIAEVYGNLGINQETFDDASDLRQEAKEKNAPHHILGKPLKEESALNKIENVKDDTFNLLKMGEQLLNKKYEETFTYEMLDKYDPLNAVIGLLCSCCATIESSYYGSKIAKQTVLAKDVQNLVVRDNKGKIIAKCAMYVDEKYGFIVINGFEMNDKYRTNEILGGGFYQDSDDNVHTQNRQKIFDTFMRGIKAFVKEYDKQHPNKPIKQVNVGVGYNRLKEQCIRLNKTEAGGYFGVPKEYSFEDASLEQYTLYKREKSSKKKSDDEPTINDVCF